MDYHIKQLSYFELVDLLMAQISPETRALVLEQLIEINNQLLYQDLSRSSALNSRKKDISENQHPSFGINHGGMLPYCPRNMDFTEPVNRPIQKPIVPEINLDDLIDELEPDEPTDLDAKLDRVKQLHQKITSRKKKLKSNITLD